MTGRSFRVVNSQPLGFSFQFFRYSVRTSASCSGRVIGAALPFVFVDCGRPRQAERRMWIHWCAKSMSAHCNPSASLARRAVSVRRMKNVRQGSGASERMDSIWCSVKCYHVKQFLTVFSIPAYFPAAAAK